MIENQIQSYVKINVYLTIPSPCISHKVCLFRVRLHDTTNQTLTNFHLPTLAVSQFTLSSHRTAKPRVLVKTRNSNRAVMMPPHRCIRVVHGEPMVRDGCCGTGSVYRGEDFPLEFPWSVRSFMLFVCAAMMVLFGLFLMFGVWVTERKVE
ncbi:uncharacterized protein LY89DRAFT_227321 [Mollisia scopiformis]|uniref:Uncharacterized protein n=1 Tax=Mollisia scopiformis TaxID=149040 RepID=A0A194WV68_MOLSC|nr:uncharacterized protein LY89DRAFT_227321 [Mollisia scopiformis]KUJ11559.1 hypothetical protein LY89DRAFT_227321 [Mollisia scopiformis]